MLSIGPSDVLSAEQSSQQLRSKTAVDVLFTVTMVLLLTVHAVIFVATLVIAPVTQAEQLSLDLLRLPVEAARILTLPFAALLLASLYVLGSRIAGRWGGMAAIFAVLALNLRADAPDHIVYGPSIATGGWAAAALLATALAVVQRHRRLAAVLLGLASVLHGLLVLAVPAFLVAFLIFPSPLGTGVRARLRSGARFLIAWAIPFVLGQAVWLIDLGVDGYTARFGAFLAEFRVHTLVPWLDQQALVFGMWHFTTPITLALVVWLFLAAGVGVARYFAVPRPEETSTGLLTVLRRFPLELWAGAFTVLVFSTWWAFSGDTWVVDPNLPTILAVVPLITAQAYRGSKWLLTVGPFWRFAAIAYLTGLVFARTTQLGMTLVQAFQR